MRTSTLLCLGMLGGCLAADAPHDPDDTDVRVLDVPRGASASRLTDRLEADGLVDGWRWRIFARLEDVGCLKAGRHEVSGAMSMVQLRDSLCGPPLPEDVPFTVVEGWRIVDIDAALADKGWIAPGAYAALATTKAVPAPFEVPGPTYEGYLFPDTYGVVPDRFDAAAFLTRQLATFDERVVKGLADDLGDRSLHDVVVMASMIEREEPTPAQRPVVAGILWKRLDNGWNLGVDATSRYELGDDTSRPVFLKKLRDPDDPYNTRLRGGLPPTAIGNPGLESLRAAAHPEDSPWWYYLHDASGTFHGAKDAAGHTRNRERHGVW